jgi:crotonobetainyl-CoA:carnitine CoA-transferase CaiB-like acyl-CoA transferase
MANLTTTVLNSRTDYHRLGTWHPQFAPCEVFRCGDGEYLSLCVIHDRAWRSLCDAVGRPELQSDPRFADNLSRVHNRVELREILESQLASTRRDDWLIRLEQADMTVAPLLSLRQSLERFRAEVPELTWLLPHARLGQLEVTRPAYRFKDSPVDPPPRAAPDLGEHTDSILTEFGFTAEMIAALRLEGAI